METHRSVDPAKQALFGAQIALTVSAAALLAGQLHSHDTKPVHEVSIGRHGGSLEGLGARVIVLPGVLLNETPA